MIQYKIGKSLQSISFRAVNEAELERLCEEKVIMTRKIAGLESDLNIQQQKNASLEKQLGEAESNIKQVRGRFHFM